jgi:hypothetical protein
MIECEHNIEVSDIGHWFRCAKCSRWMGGPEVIGYLEIQFGPKIGMEKWHELARQKLERRKELKARKK